MKKRTHAKFLFSNIVLHLKFLITSLRMSPGFAVLVGVFAIDTLAVPIAEKLGRFSASAALILTIDSLSSTPAAAGAG